MAHVAWNCGEQEFAFRWVVIRLSPKVLVAIFNRTTEFRHDVSLNH
jgi:hypothetical protein